MKNYWKRTVLCLCISMVTLFCLADIIQEFQTPPHDAKPWTFWFWINGNITKEGITKDLEAFAKMGIGGVMWMEVSGPYWAPDGETVPGSPAWHEAMQWAFKECARLDMEFDMTLDFGYGCGGPHITPENSMQEIFFTEMRVQGGQSMTLKPQRPNPPKNLNAWLRPGTPFPAAVKDMILNTDSYHDIAVLAIPSRMNESGIMPRIDVRDRDGTIWGFRIGTETNSYNQSSLPVESMSSGKIAPALYVPLNQVVNLTEKLQPDGSLVWEAPAGEWIILRMGHDTRCKLTRPCPEAAVGLECDRLSKTGIEAHFNAFLKKIFEDAGDLAGKSLTQVHIDSWEAGGQNWTAKMPEEFQQRRGYDITSWLPVLLGYPIESADKSEAFLKDMRRTVNEMTQDNYVKRLMELAKPYGIRFSSEPYGHLCIDNVEYGAISDMPMGEFWALGDGKFPSADLNEYSYSSKMAASSGHTHGHRFIGAESWTGGRAWDDHPYLLKQSGDQMLCDGINRFVFHLSAHQPYDNMVPGLTHRRWGIHVNRFNTWFPFSKPWNDYLARCQYLLQKGLFVADVCFMVSDDGHVKAETMPATISEQLNLPAGYDYDVCTAPTLTMMTVDANGYCCLPSGMRYRYLAVPPASACLPGTLRQIESLRKAGARIVQGVTEIRQTLAQDKLVPDFTGAGLSFIHRKDGDSDIYFVSHPKDQPYSTTCGFRVPEGRYPSIWDPETGEVFNVTHAIRENGQTVFTLNFEPVQSFLVVFTPQKLAVPDYNRNPFVAVKTLDNTWSVTFDPRWGGPAAPVKFTTLQDWSKHSDPAIYYYSGTATYRTTFTLDTTLASLYLNLGQVEVMAHVKLNGEDCGITWKPPYRVELKGTKQGENLLEIEVFNLWRNRMIGDEQLAPDGNWQDYETLLEWPDWFLKGEKSPTGRYTFTGCRHYQADSPLSPSGLLGPTVTLETLK